MAPATYTGQFGASLDIVLGARYNGSKPKKNGKARWLAPSHRGRSQGSQQTPGNHSGYMGLSAHLAGEPVVLRLMDA